MVVEEEEEESVAEIVPTSTSIPKTVVKRTKRSVKTLPVDAIPPLPKWKKEDNDLNVLLKEMGFNWLRKIQLPYSIPEDGGMPVYLMTHTLYR